MQACRLYAIVDTRQGALPPEDHAEGLALMGVKMLQVRAKDLDETQAGRLARSVRSRLAPYRTLLILNDFAGAAVGAGCDGVHLGQDDLPAGKARELLGPEMIIGVSCKTPDQARQAQKEGADYIGMGPVFVSETKPGGELPGLDAARQIQDAVTIPAFAIGGIHTGNASGLVSAGIFRAAVCKALTGTEGPAAVRELMRILGEHG